MVIFTYSQTLSSRADSPFSFAAPRQFGCAKPLYWSVRVRHRATLHVVSAFCISVCSGDIHLIPSSAPESLACYCPSAWAHAAIPSYWDNTAQSIAMILFVSCWNKHTQCHYLACIWDLYGVGFLVHIQIFRLYFLIVFCTAQEN